MKLDKLNVVLLLGAGLIAILLWRQTSITEAAEADAERYKRFAVWSMDHAEAELAAQVERSAGNQRALEQYLTDDARSFLSRSQQLTLPPLPNGANRRRQFVGTVDIKTFEEIQALRRSSPN